MLVVGGSGYLGQHLLAALAPATDRLDVAFTHHSQAPPQPLLDALPSVRAIRANSSAALASSQHQPAYDLTFSSAAAHPVVSMDAVASLPEMPAAHLVSRPLPS